MRVFVFAIYWISSTAAMDVNTINSTTKPSNESSDKPFSCEWKDLEFPITYGPGIACGLCILIGGFELILGEDKTLLVRTRMFLFATLSNHFTCCKKRVVIFPEIHISQH